VHIYAGALFTLALAVTFMLCISRNSISSGSSSSSNSLLLFIKQNLFGERPNEVRRTLALKIIAF